ncbi:hypothetical protein G647_03514 [Cladophialophora carrionii CBS 160.54]|uniref:Uncharacterized protein n=1 Tax=Cladophialophora carrionii CBS 160.54 TaxID=1279043 RepID=V9DBC5_9EURO|nr:uncharacterized protein G647_03514 [Cladophialophora carrionii CBS 160.54]ETI24145.1 hypothetical protein G647_03514 [Cladophialophora carrionii CBS 160.54]
MASAQDIQTLSQLETPNYKAEEGKSDVTLMDTTPTTTPKPALTTPCRASRAKAPNSTDRKSTGKKSTGSGKRDRRGRIITSDTEMASEAETTSGSEAQISPTPRLTRTLRARKARVTDTKMPENSDKELDAGAKDYGSSGSDGEYNFEEEKKEKAAKKAKEAKLAARRASRSE